MPTQAHIEQAREIVTNPFYWANLSLRGFAWQVLTGSSAGAARNASATRHQQQAAQSSQPCRAVPHEAVVLLTRGGGA